MTTRKVNSYVRLILQTEELIEKYVKESDRKLARADGQEIKKLKNGTKSIGKDLRNPLIQ